MGNEILSVTDENAILITAEFLEDGVVLKVGERTVHRYEIDLIVKKNITCGQLLHAIEVGLKNKLLREFNYDVTKEQTYSLYRDELDICGSYDTAEAPVGALSAQFENELPDETDKGIQSGWAGGLKDQCINLANNVKSGIQNAVYKYSQARIENSEKELQETLSQKSDEEKDLRSEEERMRDGYIVCWNAFQQCYRAYLENYPQEKACENSDPYMRKRSPVIGRSSVNYRRLKDGSKQCVSDRWQILLYHESDHTQTLDELGFMTTTRLIFDPVSWHQSFALFDVADTADKDSGQKQSPVNLAFSDQLPEYNISDNPIRKLDSAPVHVIPPTDPPKENKTDLLATLVPAIVTAGSMLLVRAMFMDSASSGMLAMSAAMPLAGVLSHRVNSKFQHKEYVKSLREWKNQYERYVISLIEKIKMKQQTDIKHLKLLYPAALSEKNTEQSVVNLGKSRIHESLVNKALWIHGDIYSRNLEHPDFLAVRLGVSQKGSHLVPSAFEIQGEKREVISTTVTYANLDGDSGYPFTIDVTSENIDDKSSVHYLIDLPADLANHYAYLTSAPVMLRLRACRALGVIYRNQNKDVLPFLANLIFDLAFHHSPDNLQFVMLCDEVSDWQAQADIIRHFKHLPHFRELLGDLSPFVFNKNDAYLVFNKLLEILADRKNNEESAQMPHIVVIVQNEHEIKRHRISEFLPEYTAAENVQDYGVTFVFCTHFHEKLPQFCGQVVEVNEKDEYFLMPHEQVFSRESNKDNPIDFRHYRFVPDLVSPNLIPRYDIDEISDDYYRAFKTISALYYLRVAQSGGVPSSVDLFNLVLDKDAKEEKMDPYERIQHFVMQMWGKENTDGNRSLHRNIVKTLAVPIGKKSEDRDRSDNVAELDLHEKADGPHMLVAGTTGSGKTETILTYLINLCAYYTPEEVNLLLMDMKGAGFVNRIGELPHVVGKVTDVDGDETGTSTAYMLKRFLQSMASEVKRRKVWLNRMGVDSINGYIEARANIDEHIKKLVQSNKLDLQKDARRIEEMREMKPLPHLFLVIDEFTELMQFTSENGDLDFKGQITSLARIGRSLGFHIILISQNIENAITPDIRVNSRARLCLKVATREASREMIGTDDAASPHMPGNGRAYLLVGTGSRFDYFQSGYSGADITGNMDDPVVVTYAKNSGRSEVFYSEKEERSKSGGKKEEVDSPLEEAVPSDDAISRQDQTNADDVVPPSQVESGFAQITQLQAFVDVIKKCNETCNFEKPHQVFQSPLPKQCWLRYDWVTKDQTIVEIGKEADEGKGGERK